MLACLAAFALAGASLTDVVPLARTVETSARTLRADVSHADQPAYQAQLTQFSSDAMALSQALRSAGLTDDLPCIFKGISEDTLVKAQAVATDDATLKPMAVSGLAALLDDAILMAPMAAEAATQSGTPR